MRSARLDRDRRVVLEKLPRNAREVTEEGVTGWLYAIDDEFDQTYSFFLFHDGSSYQAILISPELEGLLGEHSGHLFKNGKVCLSEAPGSGMPTLESAYARSVVWANGVSAMIHGGITFPFSINNDND